MQINVKDLGMPKGQFSVSLDQNSQELAQATTLGNPPSSEPPQLDDHPEGPQQHSTLLVIAIYSPGQQKKFNYSAPIRDIELKFWG